MDALQAQKENVDANAGSGVVSAKMRLTGSSTFATPKRGFVIHSDVKSGKKGLKERSTKKSRRVLGDISNKHRNRQTGDANIGEPAPVKKPGLGKEDGLAKTPSSRKTPKSKVKATSTPKPAPTERVPDIEVAYGGLSSPKADDAYFRSLREEMAKELVNDTTPTLFDDFESAVAYGNWDDEPEKTLLETGAPPSPWWSSPTQKEKKEPTETETRKESTTEGDDDVPLPLELPDELPDDPLNDLDDSSLLDDLVSVDVESAGAE